MMYHEVLIIVMCYFSLTRHLCEIILAFVTCADLGIQLICRDGYSSFFRAFALFVRCQIGRAIARQEKRSLCPPLLKSCHFIWSFCRLPCSPEQLRFFISISGRFICSFLVPECDSYCVVCSTVKKFSLPLYEAVLVQGDAGGRGPA